MSRVRLWSRVTLELETESWTECIAGNCLLYDSADARFDWSKQNVNTDGPKCHWMRRITVRVFFSVAVQ